MTYSSAKQTAKRFGVSEVTIWRWARDGVSDFPKPIKLGPNCTRWRLEDIEAWEASRQGIA
ncbi:AlpA family phage regulatory protein [Halomonas sp. Mc5H-6]|uniref:helix-turn-helix transcriptional regulator n=1 Tax=Halomonas sp. Mc5H-6 TaxID=2954500 RepID=UPI00209864B0|nr:AlpA family phage regulatory protein [Halomonas sp. Mc5H-6]MCO7245252.1 AlpA family phage regulatory protein [Halomonas sp. Mc5H-6]